MRDIYTEQTARERLLRNGFKDESEAGKKKTTNCFSKYGERKVIEVVEPVGIKLRGTIDFLVNHCHYLKV